MVGSSPNWVKPKTIKLEFVFSAKHVALMRKRKLVNGLLVCIKSGVTCLLAD